MNGEAKQKAALGFCNGCGNPMNDPKSIIIEYWSADNTVYFCWCHVCKWRGEVVEVKRIVTTETD
jgi:hypothetical protein